MPIAWRHLQVKHGAMPLAACPTIPLPKGWPACAKEALLHAVAGARFALLEVVTGFENSPLPRAQYTAQVTRLTDQLAHRDEELRILRTRLGRIPAPQRPHYAPVERLAILTLRAATGWTLAETSRRFLVTPKTLSGWVRRLDEQGADALLQLPTPVNRYPDYLAVIVQQLRATVPHLGKAGMADTLARAGLHLAKSTVGRLLTRPVSKAPQPRPAKSADGAGEHAAMTAADADRPAPAPGGDRDAAESLQPDEPTQTKARTVTARYPHHLWHIDLTLLPTVPGYSTPWQPGSLPQCWPVCFWLVVVLDHFSRSVVAWKLCYQQPSAQALCQLLDQARDAVGCAPKHIVSDQGPQFRDEYRGWCDDNDVLPRFGAVGQSGSIAVLERFFRSLKGEMLRRLPVVPRRFAAMHREVTAYTHWDNQHRPHRALGGRTPAEVRDGGVAASEQPRWETRARYPLARGGHTRLARRVKGKLELVVERVEGRDHLPVVSLREAA